MDAETKRRIDNARDALVGKVPDPKGQVEQITIALTYKFMDDMDLQAVELGGERQFFADGFEEYAWSKLMDTTLGAQEMLERYSDGIKRMSDNPGAAPLFRTIFANAFLPYNDSSTLQQFLRIINEFEYDNSETLGDAYEYLTSIMGSQGDAGQFRTPRHIIEFIVDIVDPKLGERILDPACGTGGFLIAACQHILAENTKPNGESTLTPRERGKLADSLTGYDIDPGMVRIALLNMYLHGLVDPHIHEYDTLTSEDRWSEYADVIIANPPFMTPKGGIRPHSRFGVQSKRSEVLFVDYMAEHLTSNGRAGIVVPEGIIFQAQNAHKALRKMLVEEYLVAVVGLPGGVFNPYSGVKTSILILDKALARRSDNIGFFKVQNDGLDLGAQRRPIKQNDLPRVLDDVREYLRRSRDGESTDSWSPATGHVVPREKIAADGEYNLSGERYRVRSARVSKWPMVRLGDILKGKPQYGSGAKKVQWDGLVRYVRITDITEDGLLSDSDIVSPSIVESKHFLSDMDVLVARTGSVGRAYLHQNDGTRHVFAGYLIRFPIDRDKVLPEYVFRTMQSDQWRHWVDSNTKTGTLGNINATQYASFEFPLPPLDVQRELVAEIEGYQRVIDGARMVVESWRPRLEVDPGWPVVELGEACEVTAGQSPPGASYNTYGEGEPFYQGKTEFQDVFIGAATKWTTDPRRFAEPQDIVMSVRAPVGPVNITAERICIGRGLAAIQPSNGKVDRDFAFYMLKHLETDITGSGGTAFDSITIRDVKRIQIPLPPDRYPKRDGRSASEGAGCGRCEPGADGADGGACAGGGGARVGLRGQARTVETQL